MKFATFQHNQKRHLGVLCENKIIPMFAINRSLPNKIKGVLLKEQEGLDLIQQQLDVFISNNQIDKFGIDLNDVKIIAPVPHPKSFRDAYSFRRHVETSRANRGLKMIPEFDKFPVFYFSNHLSICGPGNIYCMPEHLNKLDFELEIAVVINKMGKNIKAENADNYIGGYMLLNDFSARGLQMDEMKLNLGPAKGKDFATATGPFLVTKDELTPYKVPTPLGHIGECFDIEMKAYVNDILVSTGNLASMHWTFAEIIERASYGVHLHPGEIIGSGTVGTGCFLELNGSGKRNNPNYQEQWLNIGDTIRLEATALGELTNQIVLDPSAAK